jgi:tetratricopeptide (TPR) repeat protein
VTPIPKKQKKQDPLEKAMQLAKMGEVRAASSLLEKALLEPTTLSNPLSGARNFGFFLLQNGKERKFLHWILGPGAVWKNDPFLLLLQGKAFFRLEELTKAESAYRKILSNSAVSNSWRKQAIGDLSSLKQAKDRIQRGISALNRARFLIGSGGVTLLLGLGVVWILNRRMNPKLESFDS